MLSIADKRLNMTLSFSTPINSFVLSAIVKDTPVPINLYNHKDEIYATFFLSGISENNRVLLETMNPVLMGDILVITEKIDNAVVRTVSENVGMVPTLADGELFTRGKRIHASFRFHSSQLKEAGNLLRLLVSLDQNVDEIQLKPTASISKILDEINVRMPLSVVTFAFKKNNKKRYIVEWKNSHRNTASALAYDLDDKQSVALIDMENEPTLHLLNAIDKDHIPLASYLELHDLHSVKGMVHLPTFLLKPFLLRLYESSETLPSFKVESIENFTSSSERSKAANSA